MKTGTHTQVPVPMTKTLFCIIQLLGFHVTREVAEEVPNQASRRHEVPMAIVIDSDKTDYYFIWAGP